MNGSGWLARRMVSVVHKVVALTGRYHYEFMRVKKEYLIFIVSLFLCFSSNLSATTYYVDGTAGNNLNAGTSVVTAWRTIAKASTAMVPGDTVIVSAGVYEESVNPANDGIDGAPITYLAKPGDEVVVRQFFLNGDDYIRIIGFTLTHTSTTFNRAIAVFNSHHVEILNNYIHHIHGGAIYNNISNKSNYMTIRGNVISFAGCPTGVAGACTCANAIGVFGSHNLVEYNDLSHLGDFIDLIGEFNVIRNNYAHDYANVDFPNGALDGLHVDFWQPFSVSADAMTGHTLVENNFAADLKEINSHFFQVRNEAILGLGDFIIRGNVGTRIGSYVAQFGGVHNAYLYNNTFVDFANDKSPKDWTTVSYTTETGPSRTGNVPAIDNQNFNNIYYDVVRSGGSIIGVSSGSTVTASNNACEVGGTHASCSVTSNIAMNDIANDDFHLQNTSTAKTAGRALATVVSPSSTSSVIAVSQADLFTNGYGTVAGDVVVVGTNDPVTILAVDSELNTITLDRELTFNTGDVVVLAHQNASPAIGAYEYSDDYSFNISMPIPTTGGIDNKLHIAPAVTNPQNIRFVEILVDGVPKAIIPSAPFTYDLTVSDPEQQFLIQAKAYSRHASKTLIKSSSVNVTLQNAALGGARPKPPTLLRAAY
jgi:hypothetical protein